MSEEAPHSENNERQKRFPYWKQQVAVGLAGTALWAGGVNELANQISRANDPHEGPSVELVHYLNLPPGVAPTKTEMGEPEPDYMEQAKKSKFVFVIFSGTGMETSQYTGVVLNKTIEDLGGVILFCHYGSLYEKHGLAESVKEAVRKITPEGEVKTVIFLGQSFGGIAAEDVSQEPAIQEADFMKVEKSIMVETPMDLEDTTETILGIPIAWFKDMEVPDFNGLTTLANAINGQYLRGQLGMPEEWNNTFINAAKTSPELMHSDVVRIQEGMRKVNPNVSVDYIGSSDSKNTVNHKQAYERLKAMAGPNVTITYKGISGVDHDEIWLSTQVDKYIPTIIDSTQEVIGKEQ